MVYYYNLPVIYQVPFEGFWREYEPGYADLMNDEDAERALFRFSDVQKLEEEYPQLLEVRRHIAVEELSEKWDLTQAELVHFMDDSGIHFVTVADDPIPLDLEGDIQYLASFKAELFYRLQDVERIEEEHPELKARRKTARDGEMAKQEEKLRPSQRHKMKCREAAAKFWQKDPTLTIQAIIETSEISKACDQKPYIDKTIRNWIKDLCPNRKPGRRPKKK